MYSLSRQISRTFQSTIFSHGQTDELACSPHYAFLYHFMNKAQEVRICGGEPLYPPPTHVTIFTATLKATSLNMVSGTHTITHIMILGLTHTQQAAVRPNGITPYGSHKRCSVPTPRQRSVALPWHTQLNRNYWIPDMARGTERQSVRTE
jgi:hypothetical protein